MGSSYNNWVGFRLDCSYTSWNNVSHRVLILYLAFISRSGPTLSRRSWQPCTCSVTPAHACCIITLGCWGFPLQAPLQDCRLCAWHILPIFGSIQIDSAVDMQLVHLVYTIAQVLFKLTIRPPIQNPIKKTFDLRERLLNSRSIIRHRHVIYINPTETNLANNTQVHEG